MNSTAFGYRGQVSIQVLNNRNKVLKTYIAHNEGTDKLFSLYAKLLSSQLTDVNEFPYYIDIKNVTSSSSVLNQKLRVSRSYESGAAIMQTSIPYENIDTSNISSNTNLTVVLQNKNKEDLAKIEIASSVISNITQGMQVTLRWELRIDNTTSS